MLILWLLWLLLLKKLDDGAVWNTSLLFVNLLWCKKWYPDKVLLLSSWSCVSETANGKLRCRTWLVVTSPNPVVVVVFVLCPLCDIVFLDPPDTATTLVPFVLLFWVTVTVVPVGWFVKCGPNFIGFILLFAVEFKCGGLIVPPLCPCVLDQLWLLLL